MKHLYLFTLQIAPLEVGKTYAELPSHLTLMSRFYSNLSPSELANATEPLFAKTSAIPLVFGKTVQLGPKQVIAQLVHSPEEAMLHRRLLSALGSADVAYQYPEFIGSNHKAHVSKREGAHFAEGAIKLAQAAYLIEVVNRERVVAAKFMLKPRA